jgi:hypothetical protein
LKFIPLKVIFAASLNWVQGSKDDLERPCLTEKVGLRESKGGGFLKRY